MKSLWSFFLTVFLCSTIQAQIVVTIPEYPTQLDSIVLLFDATQPGAEELLDYTGTVYAHTGVNSNFGNWQHVIEIIPDLHKRKVMNSADIGALQLQAYTALLQRAASGEELKAVWSRVPKALQENVAILAAYVQALMAVDAYSNDQISAQYEAVQSTEPPRQRRPRR